MHGPFPEKKMNKQKQGKRGLCPLQTAWGGLLSAEQEQELAVVSRKDGEEAREARVLAFSVS